MSGYIRLYRGWRESDVFGDEPMSEREAWLWLLEHAAWKPVTRSTAKGERVRIDRGQLHVSLRNLEKVFGWGKNKVSRFIQRLVDHEMLGTASGQSGTILTILNYSKYQDDRDGRDTETGTASGQSRDTHKEGKEGKEGNDSAPAKRGTRLPTDFSLPEDWVRWAGERRRWAGSDIQAEGLNFANYWQAKPGKDGCKLDWFKTWQNWVMNSRRPDGTTLPAGSAPPAPLSDPECNAYCDRAAERAAKMGNETLAAEWIAKKRSPRREASGPPRGVGALAARIVQQAAIH